MLPSKGYFKSLNCPYFNNEFCDRPHCHFRHTRKDKSEDDFQQLPDVEQSTQPSDEVGCVSSDGYWQRSQLSASTSVSYKPTPIVELKKRHIPVTTAPSVVLSSTSHKRRIEYDVKSVKRPKVEYIPEAVNSDHYSRKVPVHGVTSSVYRATKINHPDRDSNRTTNNDKPVQQDNEESEGEIDFDQVSNELDFLDEILKEYKNPVSIKSLLDEAKSNEICSQEKEEHEQIINTSKVLTDKIDNGFSKNIPSEENNKSLSNSDCIHSHETKNPKDPDQQTKACQTDSKTTNRSNSTSTIVNSKQTASRSSSLCNKDEGKSSSEHKRKSVDNHKSEKERKKSRSVSEALVLSAKSTKKESECDSAFDKLFKNDSGKLSNSTKQPKKEHSSSSNKSSKRDSEHRSSSSGRSKRKDSERESCSNKSSTKDSDYKDGSSRTSKKESDHQSTSSKSSKPKSHESHTKRTHSHESSKKHKDSHKSEHKQGDSKENSKYKDENRHRKESNERRSSKKDRSPQEYEPKEKSNKATQNSNKRKPAHSVSESSDSDVEIISEPGSVIVIDSEEDNIDSNSEHSISTKKRKVENVAETPYPALSTGTVSPTFPSDISDTSDVENNSSQNSHVKDDSSLLDQRVQSRIKKRVSLGTTWRPPTRKPVQVMTPAQRLLLFAKLREQEEKDSDTQSSRVKIGCVPNVKLLLEEKERLLKGSKAKMEAPVKKSYSDMLKSPAEPKDITPTLPCITRHPKNRGADIYTRRSMLEKMYHIQKMLIEPGQNYKHAHDKCVEDEHKIWKNTVYTEYEKEIHNLIEQRKNLIPDFTLRYFRQLKPSRAALFPKELKKEDGPEGPVSMKEQSLYAHLLKYILTKEELEAEGYPRKKSVSPEGDIIAYVAEESISKWRKVQAPPPTGEFACVNCTKFYTVGDDGLSLKIWDCQYHAKKSRKSARDKSGLFIKKARCCGADLDNPCMLSKYHSTETRDSNNLMGFVETAEPQGAEPTEGWGVYALDCEMFWSVRGLELGRVTVVNAECRTVYDTFVRPVLPVTDYATRMSGLTEDNLSSAKKTFSEVQSDLLGLFNSKTILIGHSLENDLKALQIIHSTVVDTAMVFRDGDKKQALKILASDVLNEVIQNEEDGHDSAEDAVTCLKLMLHRARKDANALTRRAPPTYRERYRVSN